MLVPVLRTLIIIGCLSAVQVTPALALSLQITAGGRTLDIKDGARLDQEAAVGTLRYSGQIGDLEMRVVVTEENTPKRQYAVTLSSPTGTSGPEPLVVNAGEPTEVAFLVRTAVPEALGSQTRTQLHYQGQITDVEDGRLALAVPLNRLNVTLNGKSAGELNLPPVQSEGEEVNFDQTGKPVAVAGERAVEMNLRIGLGVGDAIAVDEARLTISAVESTFSLLTVLGVGSALGVVGLGLFLVFRPRRRERSR